MTLNRTAGLAGILMTASVLAMPAAWANGMGTPVEPPPEQPAPTVMPPAAPEPAPIVEEPRASNWSGFYIGGHAGYAFQNSDDDETLLFDTDRGGVFGDTVNTSGGTNAFAPGFCGGKAVDGTAASGCKGDSDGIDLGLRAGYDWQFGNFVVGGLLEGSYADISDSVSGFSTTPASYTMSRDLNFLGAARLRAGFATDNLLFYATGGAAYGDVDHSFATTNNVNSFSTLSKDDGLWGWQAGGGAEYRLSDSISLGVEYIYTSLDDSDYAIHVGAGSAPATNPFLIEDAGGTDLTRSDDRFDFHSVRATVNYRFGG
ncbi:MAG: porin family protein [Alphaproteobacteria bacterium]|nr:porin family protein [Alphaproteobacteria bacterium]